MVFHMRNSDGIYEWCECDGEGMVFDHLDNNGAPVMFIPGYGSIKSSSLKFAGTSSAEEVERLEVFVRDAVKDKMLFINDSCISDMQEPLFISSKDGLKILLEDPKKRIVANIFFEFMLKAARDTDALVYFLSIHPYVNRPKKFALHIYNKEKVSKVGIFDDVDSAIDFVFKE